MQLVADQIEARAANEFVFRFMRNRVAFVAANCDSIESYIVWGATVDAVIGIGAALERRDYKGNRERFTWGLSRFAPMHRLETISVPLLLHDVEFVAQDLAVPWVSATKAEAEARTLERAEAEALLNSRALRRREAEEAYGPLWDRGRDLAALAELEAIPVTGSLDRTVRQSRYAEILYSEYRCTAVHELSLGARTHQDPLRDIAYMNYQYSPGDRRAARHRYRARISFSGRYLVALANDIVTAVEDACAAAGWVVPPQFADDD